LTFYVIFSIIYVISWRLYDYKGKYEVYYEWQEKNNHTSEKKAGGVYAASFQERACS